MTNLGRPNYIDLYNDRLYDMILVNELIRLNIINMLIGDMSSKSVCRLNFKIYFINFIHY